MLWIMKIIGNILSSVLFAVAIYGLVISKSIAYCCGGCSTESIAYQERDSCCGEERSSCCASGTEEGSETNDCGSDPCRSEVVHFDWSPASELRTFTPPVPEFQLFYPVQPLVVFSVEGETESLLSSIHSPPVPKFLPKDYLSFIQVLII